MNGYFRFGFITSGLILLLFALLALGTVKVAGQPDVPRWKAFWNASPNEIGDTIAGVAGTLAFLWIIVTVMIQGSELRLQRRELAMTRRELKAQREASERMAAAQDAQARTLESQFAILGDEKTQRDETRAKDALDGHLNNLRSNLQHSFLTEQTWRYFSSPSNPRDTIPLRMISSPSVAKEVAEMGEVDFLQWAKKRLVKLTQLLEEISRERRLSSVAPRSSVTQPIEIINEIENIRGLLPVGQRKRLHAIDLNGLRQALETLASKAAG